MNQSRRPLAFSRKPPEHIPVLLEEALEWLRVRAAGVYVDCTAGLGGHALAIATRLEAGRLIALDRDPEAVRLARERLAERPMAEVVHAPYSALSGVLEERGIGAADGILIDAGVSSMQLDAPERGFSFEEDGPLDMRMNPEAGEPARVLLARTPEEILTRWLKEYGDVRPAKRIAAAICARAQAGKLETTVDLRAAVAEALPWVRGVPGETRTVFQAVRMAVNAELEELASVLEQAIDRLAPGGRLVAITFHSGEDRIVKNVLRNAGREQKVLAPDGRIAERIAPRVDVLTPKPLRPGEEECRRNRRAASARLRAAQRL